MSTAAATGLEKAQEYRGRVVYITGAASGLGRGLAMAFGERGASLALVDLSTDGLEGTRKDALSAGATNVTVHTCDVSQPERVHATAAEVLAAHKEVHVLCANAGVGFTGLPLSDTRTEDVEWVFGVNTFGVFETVRSLLPSMLAHGKPAHILCTASLAAIATMPGWHIGVYSGSKFAVAALAQSMRDEIGEAPIKVSVTYPGLVATNIGENASVLRPKGDALVPEAPAELMSDDGMLPSTAAEIILSAMEAGLPHIFTHPGEAQGAHQAVTAELESCFAQSQVIVDQLTPEISH